MIIFSLFVAIAIEAFNKLAVKEEVVEGGQPRQKRVSTHEGLVFDEDWTIYLCRVMFKSQEWYDGYTHTYYV